MKVYSQGIVEMYQIQKREIHIKKPVWLTLAFVAVLLLAPGIDGEQMKNMHFSQESVQALNRTLTMAILGAVLLCSLAGRKGRRALLTIFPSILLMWKFFLPIRFNGGNGFFLGVGVLIVWSGLYFLVLYGAGRKFLAAFTSICLSITVVVLCWLAMGYEDGTMMGGILIGSSGAMFYGVWRMLEAMERSAKWWSGEGWKETAMVGMATGRMDITIIGTIFISSCVGASLLFFFGNAKCEAFGGEMIQGWHLLSTLLVGFIQLSIIPITSLVGGVCYRRKDIGAKKS